MQSDKGDKDDKEAKTGTVVPRKTKKQSTETFNYEVRSCYN